MEALRIFDGETPSPGHQVEEVAFARLPVSALRDRRISAGDKIVLAAVMAGVYSRSAVAVKRNCELARDLGVAERSVQRSLRKLEAAGYIRCEPDLGIGAQRRINLLFQLRGATPASPPGATPTSPPGDTDVTPGRQPGHPGATPTSPRIRSLPRPEEESPSGRPQPADEPRLSPARPPAGSSGPEQEEEPSPADLANWRRWAEDRSSPESLRRISVAMLDRWVPGWKETPAPGSSAKITPGPVEVVRDADSGNYSGNCRDHQGQTTQ